MANTLKYRLGLLGLMGVVLVLLVPSTTTFASHRKYLQEDPLVHAKSPGLPFNAVNLWWAWYDPNTNDTTWDWDGTVPEAFNATDTWEALVPELDFRHTAGAGPFGARLFFRTASDCDLGEIACWKLIFFTENLERGAAYWHTAWIDLVPSSQWSAHGRRDAVLHETGHFVGLHHTYAGHALTCTADDTIMNSGSFTQRSQIKNVQGQCVSPHADGTLHQLSATDDDNASIYWTGKDNQGFWRVGVTPVQLTCSRSGSDFLLTVSWKDGVWAEAWHRRGLWADPPGPGAIGWDWQPNNLGFTESSKPVGFPAIPPKTWNLRVEGWDPNWMYWGGAQVWNWASNEANPIAWSTPMVPAQTC